ncbi:hypothetical protein [Bradyrhizobium sp. ARR65]|uniref:hypothetical protein n=1 Tax=Bradyrhizobium sp. ARR65 TaxID=1040989 RepID=UPI0004652FB9|nr:hypothetical protein [Bradyrhizobium sp. ARR65]
MKRIKPKRTPLRPDGTPMTEDDFRTIRDQITAFDDIEWIDDATRDLVERFMPDLVGRLPEKRTETFEQAFGRMRAKAKRKVTAKDRPKRKSSVKR